MTEEYNPCQCAGAGFCSRYGVEVSEHTYNCCKQHEIYRRNFEISFSDTADERYRNEESYNQKIIDDKERGLVDKVMQAVEEEGVDAANPNEEEGLGTVLSKVFSKFGITEEKMEEWSGMGGCGCSKRKQFLNKILPFKKTL